MRIEQHFKERPMSMDADGEFTQVEVTYIVFDAESEEQALRGVHDYAPDEWEDLIITCVREVCEESGVRMDDEDTLLLISSTKGNVELLAGHSSSVEDIPVGAFPGAMAEKLGGILGCARRPLLLSNACISGASAFVVARRMILGEMCRRVVPL